VGAVFAVGADAAVAVVIGVVMGDDGGVVGAGRADVLGVGVANTVLRGLDEEKFVLMAGYDAFGLQQARTSHALPLNRTGCFWVSSIIFTLSTCYLLLCRHLPGNNNYS